MINGFCMPLQDTEPEFPCMSAILMVSLRLDQMNNHLTLRSEHNKEKEEKREELSRPLVSLSYIGAPSSNAELVMQQAQALAHPGADLRLAHASIPYHKTT